MMVKLSQLDTFSRHLKNGKLQVCTFFSGLWGMLVSGASSLMCVFVDATDMNTCATLSAMNIYCPIHGLWSGSMAEDSTSMLPFPPNLAAFKVLDAIYHGIVWHAV